MSCSRHCIHARPGVKFGDVSMEDTLLKVGWILGKVWRYIYSGWVGYQRRFGDLFTQSGLNTREGLKIYLLKVDQILKKVWISMNDTLLKVGWKLGKVWRYIYIFTQGGLDTRKDLEIYFLQSGFDFFRFGDSFTQCGLATREGLVVVGWTLWKVWILINDTLLKVGWTLGKFRIWKMVVVSKPIFSSSQILYRFFLINLKFNLR